MRRIPCFAELGYRYHTPIREIDKPEWMQEHHRHDAALVDAEGVVRVELHYHVVKGAPAAPASISTASGRGASGESGLRRSARPGPEDLLLHACIHFTYDRMTTSIAALAQLGDIAWIIDREEIDWDRLIDNARGVPGSTTPCFWPCSPRTSSASRCRRSRSGALRPPGFDERLGRRMIELRVLRTGSPVPRRSLREAVAPGREGLENSWGAAPESRAVARARVRAVAR